MTGQPNLLTRSVAAIGLSVRSKLLIAFLSTTCLLVALSLIGLNTLQQANTRTEALIRDQQRIEYFTQIHGYVGDLVTMSVGQYTPGLVDASASGSFFVIPIDDRARELQGFVGRGLRRFGQPGMPDAELIERLRADLREIRKFATETQRLRQEEGKALAAPYAMKHLFGPLRAIQADVYTVVQEIEQEMAVRARTTAQAYLTSSQNITAAGIAAVGMALLLGYALSSSLLWPIARIRHALSGMAGGGFDARISVPNRDELGELASHVNQTSDKLGELYDEVEAQRAQLAEWNTVLETKVADQVVEIERSNRLRRFLPAQVADLITGSDSDDDALATRRGEVTVLFADLRGFTSFANSSTPDQVVGALNAFHETCGPLVEAEGGTLERFLGDGLMVIFGAPMPVDDAADRAVRLALAMRDAVGEVLTPYRSDTATLGLGIGVGTGMATLGQIGFEARRDYSAIGPAPNLAARLCEIAEDGQILLSHATVWQISNKDVKPAGKVTLKGIGNDIAVFEI